MNRAQSMAAQLKNVMSKDHRGEAADLQQKAINKGSQLEGS